MADAKTNMAYNCLERNIAQGYGQRVAYHWEGNVPGDQDQITYSELLEKVACLAATLREKGVKKGDVVAIYLPMIVELPVAMLACARIGAIHSVVSTYVNLLLKTAYFENGLIYSQKRLKHKWMGLFFTKKTVCDSKQTRN